MRVAITGSRTWTNPFHVRSALHHLHQVCLVMGEQLIVMHGDCTEGPDSHARQFCEDHRSDVTHDPRPANWAKWGKVAGFRRNDEMAASELFLCLAFWDGRSRGTKDMIDRCELRGVLVLVKTFTDFDE